MTGLYDIIGVPFGYLMRFIYSIFKNYAVSIIVFTIVTRLLMFPVTFSTQKSSARMSLLSPKLEKLKKSYGSNPQRLQEEQQKLYQEEGVNPMASCLPTFIQMFLLFGVLDVVYKPLTHILDMSKSIINAAMDIAGLDPNKTGLRGELKIMEDLALNKGKYGSLGENFADRVFEFNEKFTIFGANLGKTPSLHPETWNREAIVLAAIPFLAGLSQLIFSVYSQMHQKKKNPAMQQAGGGCMNVMLYGMPLLSVWMAFTFPAGLGFYWIWSSLISFIITFALNQYLTPERVKVIDEKEKEKARLYAEKHPEKKTFMQRMLEQAEQERQQNGGASANGEKISRSEQNKQNRDKLKEARKRMAKKYGDDYDDNDDNDDNNEE